MTEPAEPLDEEDSVNDVLTAFEAGDLGVTIFPARNLRELRAKATPGRWVIDKIRNTEIGVVYGREPGAAEGVHVLSFGPEIKREDIELLVTAVNMLEPLLEQIDRHAQVGSDWMAEHDREQRKKFEAQKLLEEAYQRNEQLINMIHAARHLARKHLELTPGSTLAKAILEQVQPISAKFDEGKPDDDLD